MLPTSAAGAALPVKPGADAQVSQSQTTQPLSATAGEVPAVAKPETAQAVDPPKQSGAAEALAQEQSNEAARLTEPSRLAPEVLTLQAQAPDAQTPAGPPPTFDWSMLEKARALATTTQPETPPEPDTTKAENTATTDPQTRPTNPPVSAESEASPLPEVASPRVESEPEAATPPPTPPQPTVQKETATPQTLPPGVEP